MADRHGVRINWLGDDANGYVIWVGQTIKKGLSSNSHYVVERRESGKDKEVFVKFDDDEALLRAVRAALNGEL